MENLLEVEGVAKTFANGRGVRHLSFTVGAGDIFGLIGPNGAGKTTLLKIITGLMKPDQGTVCLFGHPVAERFEQAMEQVGCLIETADAYEHMSAYDNLRMAARFYRNLPKSRIDQVLEQVGLAAYRKEKVGIYSLGMKQRLALASALLANPRLVILDEPTNGLDIEGIVEIRNTILELAHNQGITFVISSHMIHDLSTMVNRIGIMRGGEFIRLGEVRDLLKDEMPLEQYVMSQLQTPKEVNIHA